MMTMRIGLLAAIAALSAAAPVQAQARPAQAQELRCLDNRLTDQQRAGVADLFARQTDDPAEPRAAPHGTTGASADLAGALNDCASRMGWSTAQRGAAARYLVKTGLLSRIVVQQGAQWSAAMERFAPFAARLLPAEGEPDDHARAMLAAGASDNGVPIGHDDDVAPLLAYLTATREVDQARQAFAAAQ